MNRKRKTGLFLLALFATCISASFYGRGVGVHAENAKNANKRAENTACARAECVMEISSRRVLYERNGEDKLPMASTTKIATALTVLYEAEQSGTETLDETFLVPAAGCGAEGSSVYLKPGDQTTSRELLYGLMLRSGNDCAVTLALRTAGNVKNFARMMNDTAKRAGALHTCFKNPHGLPEKGHYTTARDLTLITCLAMENEEFCKIVATREYEPKSWINKNKMLTEYEGAIGVKTGFTKQAGRCLVSAAERNGMKLVCTLLNCGDTYGRSKTLLDDAFLAYEYALVHAGETPVPLNLKYGKCAAVTNKDLRYPMLAAEKPYIRKVAIGFDTPLSDASGREICGQLRIYLANNLLFCENLYKI